KIAAERPRLAAAFSSVRAESAVKRVAMALRRLAGDDQPPLIARALRGGAPREDDWADTPVQPTILCSTVDQVGSRLLFRGYGVSDRMKPVHAGLLGSDCLILLDEAHLSNPFRQTLTAIERLRRPDDAPFGFAVLTATPTVNAGPLFALSAQDEAHPVLSARIAASKPARLVEIAGKQGVDTESRRADAIAAEAMSVLTVLRSRIANPAVGVVLNRVARARAVFERLCDELAEAAEVMLVIGPARGVDRDRLAEKLACIRTGRDDLRSAMRKPLVVVATQTIEAGVDIDFDGLVTEAAALDALRQRFGRLNRAGRPDIMPEAVVLAHKEDIGDKADDPVYGDRIAETWKALNRWKTDGRVDFGIAAMKATVAGETLSDFTAPTPDAPVLMPAHADLWSQTSPIPATDPDVTLFLHGPNRSPAGIQIAWRADISRGDLQERAEGDPSRLTDLIALMPPRSSEAIEVPLWTARAWLQRPGAGQADFADVVGREPDGREARGTGRPAFRWAGKDSARTGVTRAGVLLPGDLIVVPAAYGGCDKWGWAPNSSETVSDVADAAAWPYRARRFAVRVAPELIEQGLRAEGRDVDPEVADKLAGVLGETDDRADALLETLSELRLLPQSIRTRIDLLASRKGRVTPEFAYGFDSEDRSRGVVFVASRGLRIDAGDVENFAAAPATEGDDLGAGSDAAEVTLINHCAAVRDFVQGFMRRADFLQAMIDDAKYVADLHDAGKADRRYQAYYAGGDPYGPDATQVLAKSGQRRLSRGAWERAGLPDDWRHEALSVRLALLHPGFASVHDPELVLWLIGTHHGHGRPFFPHADPEDAKTRDGLLLSYRLDFALAPGPGPQSLAFDFKGLDWAQMFERLKAKYGIWGLARLEAFVRLADHRASEVSAPRNVDAPHREAAE
ncbi:MAG TPA: type I-U CRISPR-associated helicase/endonuclease Cas3, partial [Roseiarcus sp.]